MKAHKYKGHKMQERILRRMQIVNIHSKCTKLTGFCNRTLYVLL